MFEAVKNFAQDNTKNILSTQKTNQRKTVGKVYAKLCEFLPEQNKI